MKFVNFDKSYQIIKFNTRLNNVTPSIGSSIALLIPSLLLGFFQPFFHECFHDIFSIFTQHQYFLMIIDLTAKFTNWKIISKQCILLQWRFNLESHVFNQLLQLFLAQEICNFFNEDYKTVVTSITSISKAFGQVSITNLNKIVYQVIY